MPRTKRPVELKAGPGRCEEASTLSGEKYIPCNAPAVAIVGWKGRDDKPIRMCAMCEDHNIRNRGGYRVEPFAGGVPDAAQAAVPPIGHNSEPTDDALIAENFQLEDQIKAATAKFNEWAKPRKDRIAEIEGEIARRLQDRKADSTKTDSGTAYFSDIMNTKVESPEALFDFVAEHWDEVGSDVKINVPVAFVRSHMDENEGRQPPGMSISYFRRLNIKRS